MGEGQLWVYSIPPPRGAGLEVLLACVPISCPSFRSRHREGLRSSLDAPRPALDLMLSLRASITASQAQRTLTALSLLLKKKTK